jgi:DNA mismatch endonuclease (patch repair protein)
LTEPRVASEKGRPAPSSENARQTMRANRRVSGTEVRLRKAVWKAGGRGYRLNARLLGHPDITFSRARLAIFLHGCFWHRCPTCDLSLPVANREFWRAKFAANVARDAVVEAALRNDGWEPIVVWEHDVRADVDNVAQDLLRLVARRRVRPRGSKVAK